MAFKHTLVHSFSVSFTHCIIVLSLFSCLTLARPTAYSSNALSATNTCRNVAYAPFDYSVKPARRADLPACDAASGPVEVKNLLMGRQVTQQTDYSCDASRPCSNGACCAKTGWCNYGPEACGTDGISPNEVCWSNCDAKAECGRYSETGDKECPLNVCCSPYGFCGMTEDFCTVTDDEDTSCQSNCDQPDSGKSDGDVRKRVIGYYEAWVNNRTCNGMSIDQIPVGALTHLMFSFGYITPETFEIVPMDGVDTTLFSKMTAMKKSNKALKVMVALGGWTFNDPGTTQTVFSTVAGSAENRSKFIANLLSFMREYAFDGVDFDWEYPGADDRGGAESDGENFTKLLKELKEAIADQPIEYEVSFTTPTSYWYLRHFDLKASSDAVDFVNVMSYDLHGVWDANNPIGSNVLAHSNLTEIELALDLYWRNDVDPSKLNLGLGFYGRSFQLSDSSCYKPGCQFKGGASPGPCTANSGTLAYREIVNIIDSKNLKPYYDKTAQIKYIVWDQDQWVSYDDADTFEAKIDFANKQGLGGVLIWSIDQDTDNLDALSAVVGKTTLALSMKNTVGDDAAYYSDVGNQACYVTDCGGKCKSGFKKVTNQPCGDATAVFRHSSEDDSSLCCPLTSFPDTDSCTWRGSAPSCNGHCHDGEVMLEMNKWGDGKYCEDGNKAYCCEVPQGKNNDCYWSGMGNSCKSGEQPLTFAGTWLEDVADVAQFFGLAGALLSDALNDLDSAFLELYCCPSADLDRWKNCAWEGEPGSCFDNHCAADTQVQLTSNRYGLAESCSPRLERERVFCCDPPDGEQLFLPVPLEDLFPSPPDGDDIDTNFDLAIDDTWGGEEADSGNTDNADEAAFQFYVMVSPDEIQTSLSKRDGSSWELFNCNDAVSEEAQTVQMICLDPSEDSNCNHIYRGDGVPGTIIEMPHGQGCGPGKYAIAVDLVEAKNQTLPSHLRKRDFGSHKPTVYDLTFDYNFHRVPRAYGDTQLRVDFSNQEGYWDTVVAGTKDSMKKAKRSLEDVGGNHKRWLEEEWRDDYHFGAIDREALHKRWFGTDILDWLKGLLNVEINLEKRHQYDEDISAIILQEDWKCEQGDVTYQAKLDAVATASVQMSTSFGFTLITTIGPNMDLSQSFLHFNNEGHVEAIFTLDALAKVDYDSGVIALSDPIPIPGGSFKIYGVMTIGPHIDLDAQLKAGVSVEGHVEARVTLADWQIRQTYPEQNDEYDPEALDPSSKGIDHKGLVDPSFDASVEAFGYIEAHLMPTISFGIEFDKSYGIGKAAAELVADGWVRMRAKSDGDCAFQYGLDAGVGLKAQVVAPDAFNWKAKEVDLFTPYKKTIIPDNGDEWKCLTDASSKRSIDAPYYNETYDAFEHQSLLRRSGAVGRPALNKRLVPYGPLISLPSADQLCPQKGTTTESGDCVNILSDDEWYASSDDSSVLSKRSDVDHDLSGIVNATHELGDFIEELALLDHLHHWERRLSKTALTVCDPAGNKASSMVVKFPNYDEATAIWDNANWKDCNDYTFGVQQTTQDDIPTSKGGVMRYITEHVLEAQMIKQFLADSYFTDNKKDSVCQKMKDAGWGKDYNAALGAMTPLDYVGSQYPNSNRMTEMMRIAEPINLCKESVWKNHAIIAANKMANNVKNEDGIDVAVANMKKALMSYKYMAAQDINDILIRQSDRVADAWEAAEAAVPGWTSRGLKAKWNSFMKTRCQVIIGKFHTFFDDWMPKIEKILEGTDANNDAQFPGRATRRTKVAKLKEAVDNTKNTWTNPFP